MRLGVEVTSYIDWRTEPMSEVPEIEIKLKGWEVEKATHPDFEDEVISIRKLTCLDPICPWTETTYSPQGAIEEKQAHLEWHADGCPAFSIWD